MKHVMDYEDDVVWEESDDDKYTWVLYVSFAKLRHTPWWNSTYKTISIDMNTRRVYESPFSSSESYCSGFGVKLIPRKSGSAATQTSLTKEEEYEFSHYTPEIEISHDPSALQISFKDYFADHYLF
ncbi:hypothetical protein QVD17_16228 [Tagetes erecta]|uniref:Uncharacterized protein n=1 Tax=Tagetes erecta TaxID=13708 RepID=A0AAD8KUM7_TARER|nr:hypothetical protein QVD17_16228 [Tagetes erecta]